MSETAGIFENQSRKAHQVLNALVQTGPPEETLYLHSALSFSVMDQAEWIEDLAFICTKEYPANILVLSLSVSGYIVCIAAFLLNCCRPFL